MMMTNEPHPDVPAPSAHNWPTEVLGTWPVPGPGPEHAWSQWDGQPWQEPPGSGDHVLVRRSPSTRTLVIIVLVAATIVAILGYLLVKGSQAWSEQRVSSSPTSPTVVTHVMVPPPVQQPKPAAPNPAPTYVPPARTQEPTASPATDSAYIDLLRRADIVITDRALAIESGHTICSYLAQGRSPADVATLVAESTTLTFDQAAAMVSAAKFSYCPGTGR